MSVFDEVLNYLRMGSFIGADYPFTTECREDIYQSGEKIPSTRNPETSDVSIQNKLDFIFYGNKKSVSDKYIYWLKKNKNTLSPYKYDCLAKGEIRWVDLIGLIHDIRFVEIAKYCDNKMVLREAEQIVDIEAIRNYFLTPFTFYKLHPILLMLGIGVFAKVAIGYPIHKLSRGKFSGFSLFGDVYHDVSKKNINHEYLENNISNIALSSYLKILESYYEDLKTNKNASSASKKRKQLANSMSKTKEALDKL